MCRIAAWLGVGSETKNKELEKRLNGYWLWGCVLYQSGIAIKHQCSVW